MNNDNTVDKPTKFSIITNTVFLVINFLLAIGIIVLNFSREVYAMISEQIYSVEKPLMNSTLLDVLLRKEFSFLIIILLVWLAMKEKRIKSLKRRIFQNTYALIGLIIYSTLLLYMIYTPIINAP